MRNTVVISSYFGLQLTFAPFIFANREYRGHANIKDFTVSFVFRPLPAELAGRNSAKPATCSEVRFKNVCPKSGLSPSFKNQGENTFSRRLHNFPATVTAYIFGKKHHNQASALAI